MNSDSWISLKTELPEPETEVFICDCSAENDYSFPYTIEDTYEKAWMTKDNIWYSVGEYIYSDDLSPIECLTHWQRLPSPPNKE